jgi:hypothetical protein
MTPLVLDFVPIWTLVLGVGVFLYVLLDGFDLGVGILYGFAPDRDSRNLVMNSIAPIWDGNETWLVLGGIALLAAFPLAFAIILPAVYFPILVMLLALIFRGVAFASGTRFTGRSGITPSTMARSSAPSRRASSSAPSFRGFRPMGATSPAARSIASRRSPCLPALHSSSAIACLAQAG